ncbi:1-deoxy-D-xylulose-5-phosphate reductoisomerase [Leptospira sp. 2 VSF19]|uniref:1-deoxy-D-xylulose 5-phosphate reductoisomerase n=1 Tax=Leptospira soteropolitanensis TaxID=2950025 RepID=A0AAW5VHC0_9LEPT|nr:1-deoxy-D-xylulose-5-phosphate reductoisomerase [Leptospira soteropolitanensis]MCW7493391.1 1-deoxy-D-xylulose-5-phosphate reductoisomerase [Leptospira soteropolitanensis]MCW7501077.1 1-deoxy-D-xylulose-5-phosphate reductoisomerase [Leptospira soteropolitanensis]MCW7523243.1 1-deoxy-D-xylulose-5-phosphate reductoisomerase [Leptospira soteropolitanensis]MCW7527104.1 1-deoxy-D-xylulose-5-phosphate reductoisomerase [Leptospira soteropolitanensis]MCW7530961.1 1-deoxy-D-xylulose-5-phosphate redu
MVGVSVLGISGSVGSSTVKVLRQFKDSFFLRSFSVHSNLDLAKSLIDEFSPEVISITDSKLEGVLGSKYKSTTVLYGEESLSDLVRLSSVSVVVTAVVGARGVRPTIAAIEAGKKIAIANKETLVTFGPLINRLVAKYNTLMVPVDSEHNALFQLIEREKRSNIRAITLTASGGSFRTLPIEELEHVSVKQALNHPTWSMGPKITVDSAGLINKGLEVIEAHYLFGFSYDEIEVVIHPQSLTHGIIETMDGACLQYTSHPDMIYPIAHSLFYPTPTPKMLMERKPGTWKTLEFFPPDIKRYPGLRLAFQAGRAGGTAPCVFNAANEEAVALFLDEKISFTAIPKLIESALNKIPNTFPSDLEGYLEKDQKTREFIQKEFMRGGVTI